MPTNIDQITSADWQIKIGAPGEIAEGLDEIAQCVEIILTTERGSDPMRPSFGVGVLAHLDKPQGQAIANIKREILDAIGTWETRISVQRITHALGLGSLSFVVEWTTLADERGKNEVTYNHGN